MGGTTFGGPFRGCAEFRVSRNRRLEIHKYDYVVNQELRILIALADFGTIQSRYAKSCRVRTMACARLFKDQARGHACVPAMTREFVDGCRRESCCDVRSDAALRCKGELSRNLGTDPRVTSHNAVFGLRALDPDILYSPSTGVQDLSGLKRSIWVNSFRVAGPKSFW